jgi:hypothetical protein
MPASQSSEALVRNRLASEGKARKGPAIQPKVISEDA